MRWPWIRDRPLRTLTRANARCEAHTQLVAVGVQPDAELAAGILHCIDEGRDGHRSTLRRLAPCRVREIGLGHLGVPGCDLDAFIEKIEHGADWLPVRHGQLRLRSLDNDGLWRSNRLSHRRRDDDLLLRRARAAQLGRDQGHHRSEVQRHSAQKREQGVAHRLRHAKHGSENVAWATGNIGATLAYDVEVLRGQLVQALGLPRSSQLRFQSAEADGRTPRIS